MWSNCTSHPVNLNAPYDIPFESTASTSEKKPCDKQIKIEKELCLEKDADFQSFLLPLEQDFTKSSKGYASHLSATPDKKIKSIDYKNKLEKSEANMLLTGNFSNNDHLRNTGEKLLQNNSSNSSDHDNTNNADNLYTEKCTKFIHDTYDQTGGNMFSKIHTKIIQNSSQNSHSVGHISETKENIVHLEKCIKATHGFSINFFNSGRFSDKSDDDSSESSETDSLNSGCNNSINFDDDSSFDNSDSSSDNSIIFCEDEKIKNWFSSIEIKQTFNAAINSDYLDSSDSDDDCLKKSKERTTSIFSEDFSFEFGSVNLLENSGPSKKILHDPLIAFSSEGYINASFEDDDFLFDKSSFLKDINDSWNDSMKNISGDPHESKRV